jgi:hypothetical protein
MIEDWITLGMKSNIETKEREQRILPRGVG